MFQAYDVDEVRIMPHEGIKVVQTVKIADGQRDRYFTNDNSFANVDLTVQSDEGRVLQKGANWLSENWLLLYRHTHSFPTTSSNILLGTHQYRASHNFFQIVIILHVDLGPQPVQSGF